ncbi:hypothetical protein QR77_28150 [Streptomyces sp. 150FB]|uniref:DUF998 domain-containing protein n=1 Tax=Streptomyces sp. 150FB TaxID=1576605 RepID=UPI000588F845|nr:DUF998 domain-containing protein [Streptomyces sp. 150FB]KIF76689.1 hypothetical protein QR77_28150 [Streptomyces sp. 150FB]
MSSTTATPSTPLRVIARWAGPALIAAALISLIAEAIVATAWDRRPYSYIEDYVNFLGSPFAGEFRGVLISSPLWWVMSIAWIVAGTLVAAASIALSRRLTGWRKRMIRSLGVAQGIALILFAVFPLGPARFDDGTLPLYLLGAFLSIIAGNALAIVTGLSRESLGLPRWLSIVSITLGAIGLLNIPLTYGWVPTGLAERVSLYSYLLWALLTGLALIRSAAGKPIATVRSTALSHIRW